MMKKNYIFIASSCLFLLLAGVVYSFFYERNNDQEILLTSIEQDNSSTNDELLLYDNQATNKLESVQIDIDHPSDTEEGLENNTIYVHICGAVLNPDVYQINANERLVDLIKEAGGLVPEAAGDYINQAMVLEDGQRIYIPTKDELKELLPADYLIGQIDNKEDGQSDEKVPTRVNINTADEMELMSLPGIGQAKAKTIIDYRNKNGEFSAISNLMDVPGIKEGLFSKIEDLITVR